MLQMPKETSCKNGANNVFRTIGKSLCILNRPPTCLSGSPLYQRFHTLRTTSLLQAVPRQDVAARTPAMVLPADASQNRSTSIKAPPSHPHFDHKHAMLLLPHPTMISLQASMLTVVRCQSVGPLSTLTQVTPISRLRMAKLDSEHVGCRAETVA